MFKKLTKTLQPEFVEYQGLKLPPRAMRLGSMPEKPDETYVKYAAGSARLLEQWVGAGADSRIVDIGSGPGRLLIGMLARWGRVGKYCGMDVSRDAIQWAVRHLNEKDRIQFVQLDVLSERYNPGGKHIDGQFRFPAANGPFDVAALFSVFSHMWLQDISIYLEAMKSLLAENGVVFCTLFVEENVETEQENPPDYLAAWSGPLHCIRLNQQAFEQVASDAGWEPDQFKHRAMASGQSIYVLKRSSAP